MTRYRVGIIAPDSNVAHLTTLCRGCLEGLELGEAVRVTSRTVRGVTCEFCDDETRRAAGGDVQTIF
jgi:RNase P subunit RPR2